MSHGNIQSKEVEKKIRKTVLVVEDDTTHRALIEEILTDIGLIIIPADNGYAALDKLKELGDYIDMVLLDWDMPDMDGLETARAIRAAQLKESKTHIPIIAFTALKQPGDRERCLAAGMDDYLGKEIWLPHWRSDLEKILHKWKMDHSASTSTSSKKEKQKWWRAASYEPDFIEESVLEEARSVLKKRFIPVIQDYLTDSDNYVRTISQGIRGNNAQQIVQSAHPLKSASGSLGVMALHDIAEAIELKAREILETGEDMDALEELLPQLEKSCKMTAQKLRSYLNSITPLKREE